MSKTPQKWGKLRNVALRVVVKKWQIVEKTTGMQLATLRCKEIIMRYTIKPSSLTTDLKAFGARNNLRPTRLEVLGATRDVDSDFWLEDGLLLYGIDSEIDDKDDPSIEIMLQSQAKSHMTHSIAAVKRVELETNRGIDESLEIEGADGTVTIMRFEV